MEVFFGRRVTGPLVLVRTGKIFLRLLDIQHNMFDVKWS